MKRKILIILIALVVFSFPIIISVDNLGSSGNQITSPINYKATVCVRILRADGTIDNVGCSSNVITESGLNHIKYLLGTGISSDAVKYIALGNGTAPTSTSTSLNNEITNCGLTRAEGTYTSNGVGNWNISKTWTSTCDGVPINTTALFNASSGGTIFAGHNFGTRIVYSNDQIQINWNIAVSES
ncbi:MAG: hypothetical protein J7K62_03210 [Thermoplasmata archaeon]|nr:hypothetical protein [Thermoplasmata archaeon]